MISKKICLIGSFAVGKTSLVKRFVRGGFDEKYQTTIGVKIDKKEVPLDDETLQFIIWDLEGPDEFAELKTAYLRGAAGYLLVADATRPNTLHRIKELQKTVARTLDGVPFLLLVNKADLSAERSVDSEQLKAYAANGWKVIETSAKTGRNVESAFKTLGEMVMEGIKARTP